MALKETVSFILFGGTGDLTKRKLIPAISELVHKGVILKQSTIIGISRKDFSNEEYKDFLLEGTSGDIKRHISELNIKYLRGDFTKEGGIDKLKSVLESCEISECNRIYYLATSFKYFGTIVQQLKKLSLNTKKQGFTRVVFEKPFGENLSSSNNLDSDIKKAFNEHDTYRIDHYLGKETVKNIDNLRFTNPIIESSWNSEYIESIEIIAYESLGVSNRLEYYNDSGAIKDMIQNHLLQVLSSVLMEQPKSLTSKSIHDSKFNALRSLKILPSKEHMLGQYKKYENELKNSGLKNYNTETYAEISLFSKNKKWEGTNIYLKTGKMLSNKQGMVRINFRPIKDEFKYDLIGIEKNQIIINIAPVQNVDIMMNTSDPFKEKEVHKVNFEFSRDKKFGSNTLDAYAVLLEEVVKGNKNLFPRSDSIKESWRIVEDILKIKNKIKFIKYKEGWDPDI